MGIVIGILWVDLRSKRYNESKSTRGVPGTGPEWVVSASQCGLVRSAFRMCTEVELSADVGCASH